MASNSRIPKVPLGRKRTNENTPVAPIEKKFKPSVSNAAKFRPAQIKKSSSASSLHEAGRFSVAASSRVVSSYRSTATNIRESMPVLPAVRRTTAVPPAAGTRPKKIPAWDLKGRVEHMEKMNIALREETQAHLNRIVALEEDKSKLGMNVAVKSQESQEALEKISHLETKFRDSEEARRNFEDLYNTTHQKLSKSVDENSLLKSENTSLRIMVNELTANSSGLQAQLEATKLLLAKSNQQIDTLTTEVEHLRSEVIIKDNKIRNDETLRRQLHNTIQELKGNIRVFCRIRPPLPEELKTKTLSIIEIKDDAKTLDISHSIQSSVDSRTKNRGNYEFSFDAIFNTESTQMVIFDEISQLVQSVLDGFNVCIFAYGQTGSGKTFTMEGPASLTSFVSNESGLGVIPRSVQQIFSSMDALKAKGWSYKIQTSFIEIYNETIRDLLTDTTNKKCEIKKTAEKGNEGLISNVTVITVNSANEVFILLEKARHNRSIAATNSNEHSSRSHYIFQLKLVGQNEFTREECEGILNMVDLAGSERVKEAGTTGDRLVEAKNINKSLSSLGNVIMALSQESQHIPYRNSKLTHVLMNSLGGNSKTLMFVNISPIEQNFSETVNSLRFATKVNQCNIGTARRKVKV